MCLSGECDIVIDLKRYHLHQWDMVVAFPYSIIQLTERSEGFDCLVMSASFEFFTEFQIQNKSKYFTEIKQNPSISLTSDEAQKILFLKDAIVGEQQRAAHPFRSEIDRAYLDIILYEIAGIYSKRAPNTQQPLSRNEVVFYDFIFFLFNNFKRERSIDYYASKQHITASHLSRVIKQISGESASRWITNYTILNIKVSLKNRGRTIGEIAEEYNFPNSSFFSQYFKKYSGMTPSAYRSG